jgi:histidinol-phosphatase (PHP family)
MRNFTDKNVYSLIDKCAEVELTRICLTEHIPLPTDIDDPTPDKDCSLSMNAFKSVLVAKRNKIKNYAKKKGIRILIGGEFDFFSGYSDFYNELDLTLDPEFKVLGIHFIDTIETTPDHTGYDCFDEKITKPIEKAFCFDYSEKAFAEAIRQKGPEIIVNRYFELIKESLQSNAYDTLAHLDLINKWNNNDKYFTEDSTYVSEIQEILDMVKKKDMLLEVNLEGSHFTKRLVPRKWILQEAFKKDIPITIGSDTHSSQNIDINKWIFVFTELAKAGITSLAAPAHY